MDGRIVKPGPGEAGGKIFWIKEGCEEAFSVWMSFINFFLKVSLSIELKILDQYRQIFISTKASYGIAPKSKWPTRFSQIGHSPASARYGSRNHLCRYSLPRLACHASPYFRQDLGKQQTERQRVKILYPIIHVLSRAWMEKKYP